jgi:hypothetical protein
VEQDDTIVSTYSVFQKSGKCACKCVYCGDVQGQQGSMIEAKRIYLVAIAILQSWSPHVLDPVLFAFLSMPWHRKSQTPLASSLFVGFSMIISHSSKLHLMQNVVFRQHTRSFDAIQTKVTHTHTPQDIASES